MKLITTLALTLFAQIASANTSLSCSQHPYFGSEVKVERDVSRTVVTYRPFEEADAVLDSLDAPRRTMILTFDFPSSSCQTSKTDKHLLECFASSEDTSPANLELNHYGAAERWNVQLTDAIVRIRTNKISQIYGGKETTREHVVFTTFVNGKKAEVDFISENHCKYSFHRLL